MSESESPFDFELAEIDTSESFSAPFDSAVVWPITNFVSDEDRFSFGHLDLEWPTLPSPEAREDSPIQAIFSHHEQMLADLDPQPDGGSAISQSPANAGHSPAVAGSAGFDDPFALVSSNPFSDDPPPGRAGAAPVGCFSSHQEQFASPFHDVSGSPFEVSVEPSYAQVRWRLNNPQTRQNQPSAARDTCHPSTILQRRDKWLLRRQRLVDAAFEADLPRSHAPMEAFSQATAGEAGLAALFSSYSPFEHPPALSIGRPISPRPLEDPFSSLVSDVSDSSWTTGSAFDTPSESHPWRDVPFEATSQSDPWSTNTLANYSSSNGNNSNANNDQGDNEDLQTIFSILAISSDNLEELLADHLLIPTPNSLSPPHSLASRHPTLVFLFLNFYQHSALSASDLHTVESRQSDLASPCNASRSRVAAVNNLGVPFETILRHFDEQLQDYQRCQAPPASLLPMAADPILEAISAALRDFEGLLLVVLRQAELLGSLDLPGLLSTVEQAFDAAPFARSDAQACLNGLEGFETPVRAAVAQNQQLRRRLDLQIEFLRRLEEATHLTMQRVREEELRLAALLLEEEERRKAAFDTVREGLGQIGQALAEIVVQRISLSVDDCMAKEKKLNAARLARMPEIVKKCQKQVLLREAEISAECSRLGQVDEVLRMVGCPPQPRPLLEACEDILRRVREREEHLVAQSAAKLRSSGSDLFSQRNSTDKPPPDAQSKTALAQHQIQQTLVCPITQERIIDPVMASDGHTYERQAIELWLSTNHRSPMTNSTLPNKDLHTNWMVKALLELSGSTTL